MRLAGAGSMLAASSWYHQIFNARAWPWPLIVLRACGGIAGLVFFLWLPRRSLQRPVGVVSDEEPELRLVGGSYWLSPWRWPLGASWPLVTLETFTWGLRIAPRFRFLGWLLPTTELSWGEIATATVTRGYSGIRFKVRGRPAALIRFRQGWTGGIDGRVLALLRSQGVHVDGIPPPANGDGSRA